MRMSSVLIVAAGLGCATTALAQVENADLRIRADFRTPSNDAWGAHESVGHAEFRIHSRFLQLYYGGVHRNDEFRFTTQIDFTNISDFATNYAASPYNSDYDVYINNSFVGRVDVNASTPGFGELAYKSRHPELPELPLPQNFPDPVEVGDVVRVYFASAALPNIGDPRPAGAAILQADLVEEFARGDANQDGHVDGDDYTILAARYDPFHALGAHVGPANGDFTGDNLADLADYQTLVANWDDNAEPPAEPAPTGTCPADLDNGSGVATPDGAVDISDLLFFLRAFELGDERADLDNGSLSGGRDGGVDINDLIYFLTRFELGC